MRFAFLRAVGNGVLDLLYPSCCAGCAGLLETPAAPLCTRCLRRLERVSPEEVPAQFQRLPQASALAGGFVLWHFDKGGLLQQVQHTLKYGNRPHLGLALGRLIGAAWRGTSPAPDPPDGVVPIPLHRSRLYERGYNQSAWLARGIAEATGAPVLETALRRSRTTRSQTRLTREARWTNVAGAFVATERVDGRRLLLVDDVLTTGATAAAAAQVLRDAGAASVYLLALALARH